MSFVVGLLVGVAAGAVLVIVVRQSAQERFRARAALPTAIAGLALLVAVVAFVRSNDKGAARPADDPSVTTATTIASAPSTTSTTRGTTATTSGAMVDMPNLIGEPSALATSKLTALGLEPDVETLPLANVPAGYVVSQTPLPGSRVPRGATAVIGVSSPA